jgi:mono/diheme cytochrome c family protein
MRTSFTLQAMAIGLGVCWFAGLVGLAQTTGQSQTTQIRRETARPIASIEGKDTYAEYCAVCHGRNGTGNGPAAPALKVAPTDLTRLAAMNGGKFDGLKIERLILGKDVKVPPSHGAPDMPIWGTVFHAMSSDNASESLRIQNLVSYLKTIQAK